MNEDNIDIKDLEAFIEGLKNTLDTLDNADLEQARGFQAQLAKAISKLRVKRVQKFEPMPKFIGKVTKEDIKKYLLRELEQLHNYLESNEYKGSKFKLVMKIAKLREEITQL